MTRYRSDWTTFRSGPAIVAIVALAIIVQGCATRRDRSQELGSAGDYLAEGQYDRYAYGRNPYDPYLIGYDPYWAWWYPAPIYYYSRGDGDHDCDDGNCAGRVGEQGGQHKPSLGTGATQPGNASHAMAVAGIPHTSSAPAVASALSGAFGNGRGFGGGHGFAGGGVGGAHGGFGHH
jgi:hypothetical protein